MPVWFANFQLIEQFALVQSTALFCAPHLSSLSATITSDGRRASTDRPPAGSARHGAHKNHTRRPTRPSCFTERTPLPCHFAETKRDVCERVRWQAASRAEPADQVPCARRRGDGDGGARCMHTHTRAREHLQSRARDLGQAGGSLCCLRLQANGRYARSVRASVHDVRGRDHG